MSRTRKMYGGAANNINLRTETSKILSEVGRAGLIRRIMRDANNKVILCPQCRVIGNQDHSLYHICDRCLGAGMLWEEEPIIYYEWPGSSVSRSRAKNKNYDETGIIDTDLVVIYLEAHVFPTTDDKLISLKLDMEGNLVRPYVRDDLFEIRGLTEYRADNGKLEYWRTTCNRITVGYYGQPHSTWRPGARRTP